MYIDTCALQVDYIDNILLRGSKDPNENVENEKNNNLDNN